MENNLLKTKIKIIEELYEESTGMSDEELKDSLLDNLKESLDYHLNFDLEIMLKIYQVLGYQKGIDKMITITYNEGDRHWENEMEIEDSELAKTKKN